MITPLPWQQSVLDSPAKYNVVAAGRRAGKTELTKMIAERAVYNDQKVFIFVASHPMVRCFYEFQRKPANIGNGEVVNWYSRDVLKGIDLKNAVCIFDSCFHSEETTIGQYALNRAAISNLTWRSRGNQVYFLDTPSKNKTFRFLYLMGLLHVKGVWSSQSIPTSKGFFTEDSTNLIASYERLYPLKVFKREILAQF